MKRIHFILLLLLITLASIYCAEHDNRLIRQSEAEVEALGGLYLNDDGYIISVYPYHGKDAFLDNISNVTQLGRGCELPVYFTIPPRKMDVFTLPDSINTQPHSELFSLAEKQSEKSGITYIDLLSVLKGTELYFATDHHWTSRGAYMAYREIATAMGKIPLEEIFFEIKTFYTEYRGSDYGKFKGEYENADTIELYFPDRYKDYTVTLVDYPFDENASRTVLKEMYYLDVLNIQNDKYCVYFKGNVPFVTIENPRNTETLLIVRDSFASALAPFLACHYNIVMVDPRFYPEKLSRLTEEYKIDAVLVIENMGSLTEHTLKFTY